MAGGMAQGEGLMFKPQYCKLYITHTHTHTHTHTQHVSISGTIRGDEARGKKNDSE
jgi:hypothetical protein